MDINHIEGKEFGPPIPISTDITDDPFDNYVSLFSVLQKKGYPIIFGEGNGSTQGINRKPTIGAYTNSPESEAKIRQIIASVGSTMGLIGSSHMAMVGLSRGFVEGQKMSGRFSTQESEPQVNQDELAKLFMRAYDNRIQVNRLHGIPDTSGIQPQDAKLYNQLKTKGVQPISIEEVHQILRRDIDKVLQDHPELMSETSTGFESDQPPNHSEAK